MGEKVYSEKKGPLRPYLSIETKKSAWLSVTLSQRLQLLVIVVLAIYVRTYDLSKINFILNEEYSICNQINNYLKGTYLFDINPPFVGLLYTYFAKFFNYSVENLQQISLGEKYSTLPFEKLRLLNAVCGSVSIIFSYRALRASGVNHLISIFGTLLFLVENTFVTQERLIIVDGIFTFLLSLFVSTLKTIEIQKRFSLSWFFNLLISGIALGLTISSHWAGSLACIYLILSLCYELWILSGDINISLKAIWANFFIKLFSYLSIAISIYLYIFNLHFSFLTKKGPSYNLLSPEFQYSLENNHLDRSYANVMWGSTIMLRHYKTGKYLHSHGDSYKSTNHQQITAIDNFDDTSNCFNILPLKGDIEKLVNDSVVIQSPYRVNLKHINTNSSLVIDSEHKPPLSEQEYNMQVTTDKDFPEDEEKQGSSRLLLQFKMANKYCKTEESTRALKTVDSVFQIYNEKNSCYLMATSLIMHDGFGEGQNEVICIKEPDYVSSLWFIDWNQHKNFNDEYEKFVSKNITFWEKLLEINKLTLKKLLVADDANTKVAEYSTSISDWILLKKGYTHLLNESNHVIIYLLGNIITYYAIIVSLYIFVIFKGYEIATFNPFNNKATKHSESWYKYDIQLTSYLIGYISFLIPMKFIELQLNLYNYLPALFFGILILTQTFNYGFEKCKKTAIIVLVIFAIFNFLAFYKFIPLIYGLEWSKEQCFKLLVFPTWDSMLCNFYN